MVGPSTITQALRFCAFDLRRGKAEGTEQDKILFFFPPYTPLSEKLSLVGLIEGLITFSRIFSPEKACESVETEKHKYAFYECEPDIWMALIVEKGGTAGAETYLRKQKLKSILKQSYDLYFLFFGKFSFFLPDSTSNADALKKNLEYFYPDFFLGGNNKFHIPKFIDNFYEDEFVQILNIDSQTMLNIQSLISFFQNVLPEPLITNVAFFFQNFLLFSTLPDRDTSIIYAYYCKNILPPSTPASTSSLFSSLSLSPSSSITEVRNLSLTNRRNSVLAKIIESHSRRFSPYVPNKFYFRPLHENCWKISAKKFLEPNFGISDKGKKNVPVFHLPESKISSELLIYQHENLSVAFFLPVGKKFSETLKKLILKVEKNFISIEESVSAQRMQKKNNFHFPGHRYLFFENNVLVQRRSPDLKLTTLTKDSLTAFNRIRNEIDRESAYKINKLSSSLKTDSSEAKIQDTEEEICARTKNNSWIFHRKIFNKELFTVMERASETLLIASENVEKLSKTHFDNAFPSD